MIRLVCNLLVFGAALFSIHTIAGAQENQIKKTQVKPTSSVFRRADVQGVLRRLPRTQR